MVMIDLILDCGIFIPVGSGHGNYYQLSGEFLSFSAVSGELIENRQTARRDTGLAQGSWGGRFQWACPTTLSQTVR